MAKKAVKSQSKGTPGKMTGVKARRAISAAKKKGLTSAQIGRGSNRAESTIDNIASGNIKNPPKGLAARISKVKGKKKK